MKSLCRVATDLENLEKSRNLKEISESQGICDTIPNVREFCCLKFIFSQDEDHNFEHFLGERAPRPPLNGLKLTIELNLGQGKVREFHIIWKVATLLWQCVLVSISLNAFSLKLTVFSISFS